MIFMGNTVLKQRFPLSIKKSFLKEDKNDEIKSAFQRK